MVAGKAVGTSIVVEDELIIGRQAPEPGRLADDEEISRSHARISLDASGFCTIEDLGSMNGTFVNGLRISGPHTLAQGDTIELGSTTLVVRDVPSQAPTPGAPTPVVQPTLASSGMASSPSPGPGIEPPPAPAGEPPGAAAVPALELRLEVNFEAREARIELAPSAEPIRLVWDAGAWRTLPASDGES
jgi:pSer/pThr/pTyr-binding forkhead associated (FHA) protein